jgi:predicted nucleic acid-binding protein
MEGRCGARARLLEAAATAQGTSPATLAGKAMQFLAPLDVVPFDDEAAAHFARVKASLAAAGSLLGPMDLLIAATVRARGAVLVTNNLREFSRVPGLRIENWMV